jgi:hypothetical protein
MTGWLLARRNSRVVTMAAVLSHCAALPLLGLANSTAMLMAALMVSGAAGGAADVAINAEGSAVDKEAARPVMSSFHALYSMGGMFGAAAGAMAVKFGAPIAGHFAVAAAVLAAVSMGMAPELSATVPEGEGAGFALPPKSLLAVGALAFCILFGERAMADWTGIYLVGAGATASFAAYGYAAFSGAMTVGRFAGDGLIHRFGAMNVVRTGCAIAAAGLVVSLAVGTPMAGLVGFAAVGLGFAAVVPILFRAGGRTPGIAPGLGIAAVTTMGYLGLLTGPPLVGFAARAATLRVALLLVALLSAAVSVAARRALRSHD